MTSTQIRALFYSAAVFNWCAAVLFFPPTGLARLLGLLPLAGNGVFDQIALLAIFGFGIGYALVAYDPPRNRGVVVLGAVLKLGVVAIIYAHSLVGDANVRMALLVTGDLIYAALFLQYLRTSRSDRGLLDHARESGMNSASIRQASN